ncbi:hypothetical protein GCM10010222_33590 [Streptomyces tanashiensis]|nr:hypothetical protein GCM10010222_33590 [Streptomyces tanashiensis]
MTGEEGRTGPLGGLVGPCEARPPAPGVPPGAVRMTLWSWALDQHLHGQEVTCPCMADPRRKRVLLDVPPTLASGGFQLDQSSDLESRPPCLRAVSFTGA